MKQVFHKVLFLATLISATYCTIEAKVLTLSQLNEPFEQFISKNPYVIIKFWMTGCPPCKKIAPFFEKVAQDLEQSGDPIVFLSINVQEHKQIAQKYMVLNVPQILYLKNGLVIGAQRGGSVSIASIRSTINQLFSL